MRKRLRIVILIMVIINLLNGCSYSKDGQDILSGKELVLEEIQDEIIRFHVLANSDTEEDQALKLKVRDRVIKEMSSKFNSSNNIDDAREIMLDSIDEVNAIAKEVIEENGYNYDVRSELSRENFPDKMYGDTLYPQGEYEAFRILIGEANGQNWWCVMFPPLCFVDETKQAVNSDKTKETLEETLNLNKDNKKENNNKNKEEKDDSKNKTREDIKFKFKLLEIFTKN